MAQALTPDPNVEQVIAALNERWWTHQGSARTARADAEAILNRHDTSPHGHRLPTLDTLGFTGTAASGRTDSAQAVA